jgi:ketosteroid isomerase-like protein
MEALGMRRSWTILLAFPFCIGLSNAQGNGGARTSQIQGGAALRSLVPLKLEDQWTTALVNRDARTFDQLLAPNFVYTENNDVMGRSDVIKSVNGPDKVTWARNEGMKLHDFGDVQVITGVLHLKGAGNKGAAFDKRYRFTDTWQKQSGRWRIVAAQDYLIP